MRKFLFLFLMILLSSVTYAQTKQVKGTILDAQGLSVPGATVAEKGTTNGAITDIDGSFILTVANNAVLSVSFVGYKAQEVSVVGKSEFIITIVEDTEQLEEVVITAYGGRQLRSKVTNSIASVKEETLSTGLFSNPAQALSGAVAGLRVTQTSGNPTASPTIVLRGGTNLDGTGSPLVIVDGQLRDNMSDINPDDIESMEVLKDAGATAIYGARASNGVILITTKTGKAGTSSINIKARFGLNFMTTPYEFLGAQDYITYQRVGWSKTGFELSDGSYHSIAPLDWLAGARPFGTGNVLDKNMAWNLMEYSDDNAHLLQKGWQTMKDPIDPNKTLIFKETDPRDYNMVNPAFSQDYTVSMSGGSDKGSYYASLGYNHQEGLPITSFYERATFLFNGSYKLADWITSTSNFSYNRANWRSMPGSNSSEANYFGRILSTPPTVRFEDEEGNPTLGPNAPDGNQAYQPEAWDVFNQRDKFTMVQSLQFNFLSNLYLKMTANWYYNETLGETFTKDYENSPGSFVRTRSTTASFDRNFAQTYNAVLHYNTSIRGEHNITAMLGTEAYDNYRRGFSASGSGAPTDDFGDLGLTNNGEGKRSIDSWHEQRRIASFFGNVSYDYKTKYLLNIVFRQDGYSSLLGDNRWGFFPGLSAGWVFSKEDFIADVLPFLSFGKLRTSYGINGNASGIKTYELQGSYGAQKYDGNVGYLIGTLPNPSLRWEKTTTFEIGLDMSFLENNLTTNITYYNRLTSDKYANLSLPQTTGFSSVKSNNGELRNRGVELEMSGNVYKRGDWSVTASGNISYNKNIVVSLPDNGLERNRQSATEIYTGDGDKREWVGGFQEGQEPNMLILYQAEGLYRNWKDIPGNLVVETGNINGKKQYGPDAFAALSLSEQRNAIPISPGDVRWKDINGDGKIDSYDRVVVGNRTPRWTGGFNTNIAWKNWKLYGRFDFALDYWIYDATTPWFLGNMQGSYNATTQVFDTWSESNPNAKYPRYVFADQAVTANYYRGSTMFAYKGNYLAFRELSLSYSFPKEWLNKIRCKGLDLSVTGQNLGYLTSAKTVATPEKFNENSGSGYSLPKTVLFGINMTF